MLFGDVVRIALPAFVEMVLAQLVSMADMMMVGQISPEAISAVGICTQPIMLLQMVFLARSTWARRPCLPGIRERGICTAPTRSCGTHC